MNPSAPTLLRGNFLEGELRCLGQQKFRPARHEHGSCHHLGGEVTPRELWCTNSSWHFHSIRAKQTLRVSMLQHPKSKDKTIVASQELAPLASQNRGCGESQIPFLLLPCDRTAPRPCRARDGWRDFQVSDAPPRAKAELRLGIS